MPLGLAHSIVKDVAAYFRRKISRTDEIALLRRRQELKDIFITKLGLSPQWPLEQALEVLLRDIDRMEEYPEDRVKNPKGGWPFFKTEIRGLYHSGIESYNCIVGLRETDAGLFVEYGGKTGAYQIARTPFDWIDHVDCAGDEFDFTPHIFCRFKNKGTPYQDFRIERMIMQDGRVARTEHIGMLDPQTGRIR